ncbi:hypothetical protein Tco_1137785, partial [Tanacetum coccineum]
MRDVFVPLSEPLSIIALTCTEGTSEVMPVTTAITTALFVTSASASLIFPISTDDYKVAPAIGQEGVGADANPFPNVDDAELNIQLECITPTAESAWVDCLHFVHVTLLKVADVPVRRSWFLSWSLNLYAPFPSASVTSYGPSHLGPNFLVSFAWLSSLLRYTRSRLISRASLFSSKLTSAVLSVGMLIFAGMTASVPYVNENAVSPLLDFIIVRCA